MDDQDQAQSDLQKVFNAVSDARERGDHALVAQLKFDINILYLPFRRIVEKRKL